MDTLTVKLEINVEMLHNTYIVCTKDICVTRLLLILLPMFNSKNTFDMNSECFQVFMMIVLKPYPLIVGKCL